MDRGDLPYKKDELEGRFFNSVDSAAAVEKVWPGYLATKPDFVKLVFVFSELEASGSGKSLGLRLDVAKEIVRRAKLAGLRSGAHIESAIDFHNALEAGVDLVMHLPVFPDPLDRQTAYANKSDWEAALHDLRCRRQAGGRLVALRWLRRRPAHRPKTREAQSAGPDEPERTAIPEDHDWNLKRLKQAGVNIAIGSDTTPGNGVLRQSQFSA